MECASRGLAFHSYQTSQEIIYQEHLAKGLTEKYTVLNQQMDQLIHDANAQITVLQDKMQGTYLSPHDCVLTADISIAQQADLVSFEQKNNELYNAFNEKCKAHGRTQKMYQTLKGQVMASQVAVAAGDEAENAIHTARGERFIQRMPGVRSGTGVYSHPGAEQQTGGGRLHNRTGSRASGGNGQQQGSVGSGPTYASHLQGRGMDVRGHSGRKSLLLHQSWGLHLTMPQNLHLRQRHDQAACQLSVQHAKVPCLMRMSVQHTKHRQRCDSHWGKTGFHKALEISGWERPSPREGLVDLYRGNR